MKSIEVLTANDFSEFIYEWLKINCKNTKVIAKASKYKISFFTPFKKCRLIEELIPLYAAIGAYSIYQKFNKNEKCLDAITKSFIDKVNNGIVLDLSKADDNYSLNFKNRFSDYLGHLNESAEFSGISTSFLRYLHKDRKNTFDLESNIFLSSIIDEKHASLLNMLSKFDLK